MKACAGLINKRHPRADKPWLKTPKLWKRWKTTRMQNTVKFIYKMQNKNLSSSGCVAPNQAGLQQVLSHKTKNFIAGGVLGVTGRKIFSRNIIYNLFILR